MASATSIFPSLAHSRGRSLVLPREHGAWGMLLVPLVTGAAAGAPQGERILSVLIFAAVALALFCLRTPLEAWFGFSAIHPQNDAERRLIHYSIYIYASVAGLGLAFLLLWAHAYEILLLGAAAAIAFLLQTILKRLGRKTRMNSQLAGAIALTSPAAGAYYLATGHFGRMAMAVWLANWLFAANQVHFVQLRIHSGRVITRQEKLQKGRGFLLHQAFCLLLLGLVWRAGWVPGLIVVAFLPLLVRGFGWFLESPRALEVHRLGMSELLYSIVFGVFFILGFHYGIR